MLVKRWRKQLRTPFGSTRWQSLPVVTRALARELQMFAEDDGMIGLPEDGRPGCLWLLVGAHPKERKTLARHLQTLLDRGTCEWSPEGLRFPNFNAYQDDGQGVSRARTSPETGVSRARTSPETGVSRARTSPETGVSETRNEAKSPKSHEPKPIEEEREGERELEPNANAFGVRARDAGLGPFERARLALIGSYRDRYERLTAAPGAERGDPWMGAGANGQAIRDVAAWCAAVPERAEERAAAVVEGMFADPWLGGVDERTGKHRRWPWGPVAKDPAKYAGSAQPAQIAASKPTAVMELARIDGEINLAEARGDFDALDRLREEMRELATRQAVGR